MCKINEVIYQQILSSFNNSVQFLQKNNICWYITSLILHINYYFTFTHSLQIQNRNTHISIAFLLLLRIAYLYLYKSWDSSSNNFCHFYNDFGQLLAICKYSCCVSLIVKIVFERFEEKFYNFQRKNQLVSPDFLVNCFYTLAKTPSTKIQLEAILHDWMELIYYLSKYIVCCL